MIRAINSSNQENYISILKADLDNIKLNKELLICSDCKNKLVFVDAIYKIKHFRHLINNNCSSEPESEEHLQMKKIMCEFLHLNLKESVEIKLPFGQKPDVLIKEQKIAIECQASPISTKKLIERTINYVSNGYYPFWIFYTDTKFSNRLFRDVIRKMYMGRVYRLDVENKRVYYTHDSEIFYLENFKGTFKFFGTIPEYLSEYCPEINNFEKNEWGRKIKSVILA